MLVMAAFSEGGKFDVCEGIEDVLGLNGFLVTTEGVFVCARARQMGSSWRGEKRGGRNTGRQGSL